MFKHIFKIQLRKEIVDGEVIQDQVIVTEFSPNGKKELSSFRFEKIDLPNVIELLKGVKE